MGTKVKREVSVDILRALGTAFVILAHVYPPKAINTFRSFDVCLLVLISGFAYAFSQKQISYPKYVLMRVKRLCIPSYITATAIFVLCLALCLLVGREFPYSFQQIAETYLFIGGRSGGIGYFWVVRIYLIMALIAPLLREVCLKIKSDWTYIIVVCCILALNQLVYIISWGKLGTVADMLIENYVMSTLGYSAIYMLGIRAFYSKAFKTKSLIVFGIGAVAYICFTDWNFSKFKYPPQATYLLYGIAVSLLLWWVIEKFINGKDVNIKVISWLSENSFNIYLSHIVILFLMSWGNKYLQNITFIQNWIAQYVIVLGGAIVISYLLTMVKKLKVKLIK